MSAAENIERVRAAMPAFNQGDIEALGQLAAPDYTYTVRGQASISGVYHGWDAMSGVLARIRELTGGDIVGTPEIVLADDDNVLMYMRVTGTRPDRRRYDSHQAYRYRMRDGKMVEGETIPVDQQAFAEFFA